MNNFPPEVYHRIFIQLDLNQRLKCMLVCRTWWRVLDKHSLLYNVEIRNKPDRFLAFKDMIEQSPQRAAQVQELRLFQCLDPSYNKRQLVKMFPNARVMNVEFGHISQNSGSSEPLSETLIECLYDGMHCELASQYLTSNFCSRLHTLVLNFTKQRSAVFPSQLKNLPVLKKLSISRLMITVFDLGTLHQNVPSLQDLTLSDVELIKDNRLLLDVTPAHLITTLSLSIREVSNRKVMSQFYRYMAWKYPNITNVQHEDKSASNNNKLIYVKGILGILQAITSTNGHRLSLQNMPHDTNIFTLFEDIDSQLKCSKKVVYKNNKLSKCLLDIIQPESIKRLALDDGGINVPDILSCMTQLTRLELTSRTSLPTINLSDYVNACSDTLQHLTIRCSDLKIGPSTIHPNSIKHLDVKFDLLNQNVCDTIPRCFPKLLKLKLEFEPFGDFHIEIPNGHPLKEAVIVTTRSIPHGFTLTSPVGTSYYLCDFDWTSETRREELEDLCMVSVSSSAKYKMELDEKIKMIRV